ncbi:hypothetical protein [Escherichia coli]|uniref:hypothetical protein n=1 Tax=Escherichia coli TaxID=562 RepID=UPI001919B9F4|nr:hypothetical protein [Escherichia coli]
MSNVVARNKMLPVGTLSTIDQVLIVDDGAQGRNTEILSVSCTGYATYGGHWTATGTSLVTHNGVNHRYRVQLKSVNLQGQNTNGNGQYGCEYSVRVKNNRQATFAARSSNVSTVDGTVRGAVFLLNTVLESRGEKTIVGYRNPASTNGVPPINVAGQNTDTVHFSSGNTVVTQQPINVTIKYADSVRLKMGEKQNDIFTITGTGANNLKWSWSYKGDTRMFDLVENNKTVPVNGMPQSYSGPVGIQAYAQNGQWGIWSGNISISVDTP